MSLKLPYYILKESSWEEPIGSVYYYDTLLGRYTTQTEYAYPYAYSVLEYYFPTDPLSTFNFPYTASAKLRIFVNNTNYASALLRIHTANSIKAKLRIQTENKAQAKLRIETRGPAQAKLYIMTFRASPRPQARLRIFADNSNYASALLRIETKRLEPAQAKLRIRTRTYNRKISMPDYYAFYNISTHGFLP
ncbi:hypothetical protein Hydth_0887 [Hydrogenobacter thermophilus TK-6]|uniref:Uncharacterized protein n=1 Tax=Hydrogenobacter thermophilus (strain DSM 6534 / IAM 12695 / TK-6) TaxID=608538 RepID=D3DHP4_HYDTT|nr:hypothetical protein [Hydrogenobacter thermophilus]ADO45283.1 hypothetical protein Hydth_0887 [Hydrogenobacter thermophilus TK-6]BAI69346.1 hypothetical protein HTH_0887 [Hydrogenobacter thermophilus TK-6]